MKKIFSSIITTMILFIMPFTVYAGPLDVEPVQPQVVLSITNGISLDKKMQSTFDSEKMVSGVAEQGVQIAITVSIKDAEGELVEHSSYDMKVGASGLFSQAIALCIGENVVDITASKEGCDTFSDSITINRKKVEIKKELENTISIPGSSKTSLFIMK